jgi:5'-deoxynucleotidase YfbR-like HD superfamily hydrolase
MKRIWVAIVGLVVAAGCGVPSDPKKQAEDVGSIAAEGALLAHDAAEGDTTTPFTRIHSRALEQKLDPLLDAIKQDRLARVAADVDRLLDQLEQDPTDQAKAARVGHELDRAAGAADEIAKAR